MDMKLEALVLPVSDVDRAKHFYTALGWREDADFVTDDDFRIVQLTPPGSAASIQFGTGMTSAPAGSSQGLYLVVDDVAAARVELVERGAEVSEVYHERGPVTRSRFDASASPGRVPGRDPEGSSYASFASFSDPDGNGWILQEITSRLPGRLGGALNTSDLAELLRDVEQHHGDYEPTAPKHHWYDWYASYIVAREHGRTADEAVREATLHVEAVLK